MEPELKGTRTIVDTTCTAISDGGWKVLLILTQSRSFDGVNWEDKKAESSAIDTDISKAINSVNLTMTEYLKEVGFTLFSKEKDEQTDSIKN